MPFRQNPKSDTNLDETPLREKLSKMLYLICHHKEFNGHLMKYFIDVILCLTFPCLSNMEYHVLKLRMESFEHIGMLWWVLQTLAIHILFKFGIFQEILRD